MKRFKSYSKHQRSPTQLDPLEESFFSKGYAVSQNGQHNATKQKISTIRSNIHSITNRIKTEGDLHQKIDLLADVADQMMVAIERLSELSTNVKNVVVANALLAENIEATLKNSNQSNKV
jgi:isopentenyl phosphate kinase